MAVLYSNGGMGAVQCRLCRCGTERQVAAGAEEAGSALDPLSTTTDASALRLHPQAQPIVFLTYLGERIGQRR